MKGIYTVIILLLLLFGYCNQIVGQMPSTDDHGGIQSNDSSILKNDILDFVYNVMSFQETNPQEKVFLHLDNTGYFLGERMWFKAYVLRNRIEKTTQSDYVPTDKSAILYVELLNPYGEVVVSRKLKIEHGEADGDIYLDEKTMNSGFYEVRAYTRYMMNFGSDAVFSRVIPIFKKPSKDGDYSNPTINQQSWRERLPKREGTNETDSKTHVRFFPEGGRFIEGLPSRIAYLVSDVDGELERGVIERTGKESSSGSQFYFNDRKGKKRSVQLPEPDKSGCALSLETLADDSVTMHLWASDDKKGELFASLLMHEGEILVCDTFTYRRPVTRTFPKQELPGGVNQLTIIDHDGHIQAERLFFIYPHEQQKDSVRIVADKTTLAPCEGVQIRLKGLPKVRYSFSAIDAGTMVNGKEGNMNTYMLLESDLKGYIANPDYYLETDDMEHRRAADLLMLIQGWRRYDVEFMDGNTVKDKLEPIENHVNLYGKVLDSKHRPLEDIRLKAYFFNKQGQSMTGETKTDRLGNYIFSVPDLYDDWSLQLVATQNGKPQECIITIDRQFAPRARTIFAEENTVKPIVEASIVFQKEQAKEEILMSDGKSHQLETVVIKGKRYFTDSSHLRWRDEQVAFHRSTIFYNCEEVVDELYDRGEPIPDFYQWLSQKNEFFSFELPEKPVFASYVNYSLTNEGLSDEGAYEYDFHTTNTSRSTNLYLDGYRYKGKPVVWLLNNAYAGTTGVGNIVLDYKAKYFADGKAAVVNEIIKDMEKQSTIALDNFHVLTPTVEPMPILLSDVKSVYISEKGEAVFDMIDCNELFSKSPASIFLYTYPSFSTESMKGRRNTHFHGYNKPTTFKMEDYSTYMLTDDFRRTLYWAPTIIADDNGDACVEFFNNSTCSEMYISVEGISPEGKIISR